ncbi:3-hydroxyacyl-CoA dehydrogenase/enoyl-CoA hydratase family protein [Opitutus sp. ER46]|uniref:3-hydroxyacyl-CoA dehydrogenase/enoyl-CoA hydratase family protein n=1 Tax=Opitutus sp. ER46 TaxID=2161864 RepID=UPI000D31E803|nr:3-hydroxyacyl-CoA dehydrogenase/enoyl-CoA hydratase family protein [Opitutus sp. ER46]PTX91209.1 3-hydroxyacyl-CoA dehydrogenase [Opitutus sp. ER46]
MTLTLPVAPASTSTSPLPVESTAGAKERTLPAAAFSAPLRIRTAAVIGAGTMGAQIAAHLANVGIPVLLLDVPPTELLLEEQARGLDLRSPAVRNRVTRTLFDRACKLSPSPLFTKSAAALVRLGNVEDNLPEVREADWVIEAILERLDLKQTLHRQLAALVRPDALVTTNTSGLPIARLVEGLPPTYTRRFFGTHFFNPPRYMKLLELIPGPNTEPALLQSFSTFAASVLGKGTVVGKDTPGFVANRIGCYDLQTALWLMLEEGLGVDDVDAITGPVIGRPKSATFRLCDVVGIDLMAQIGANLREMLPRESERRVFAQPKFVTEMIERGWWGAKKGQGFYRRIKGAKGAEVQVLDHRTLEYRPVATPAFPSLTAVNRIPALPVRLRALCSIGDAAGRFAWKHLSTVLCYAANLVPEISDDLVTIDNAMKWGYNWELGPFELWDALGVAEVVARLEREDRPVPALAKALLASGRTSFHQMRANRVYTFAPGSDADVEQTTPPQALRLDRVRAAGGVIGHYSGGSLLDLGDGVACLEFHNKMNVIGEEQLTLLREALERVRRDFAGLVIGNQGPHFSAGANLKEFATYISQGHWEDIDAMLRRFQEATSTLHQFEKPVVAAVHGYTLGGGCELAMGCDHVVASAETYMGLPEVGVGLIPGAHGTKEMLVRCTEGIPAGDDPDYFAGVRLAWETIALARIGGAAVEAAKLRYLRNGEWTLVMNQDWLIGTAKAKVLAMAPDYRPTPMRTNIPALGRTGSANLRSALHNMHCAAQISAHDQKIGARLAHVLCGGDLTSPQFVSESYILELEREAFLGLCGEPLTLARIQHMLITGKPLRN